MKFRTKPRVMSGCSFSFTPFRRSAISASGTLSWMRFRSTSSVIVSPSRTAASGPPAALSGETCRTTVPNAPPDIRESVMRT